MCQIVEKRSESMYQIWDWVIFLLLAVCSIWDMKKREIPLLLCGLMAFFAIGASISSPRAGGGDILAGVAIGVVFLGISKISKEAIGYGDSLLLLVLGIYLGGKLLLFLLLYASVGAGISALFLLWKKGWSKKAGIAFVPFLMLAYLGVIL